MKDNEIYIHIDLPIPQKERTEKFFQIAKQLSDFIKSLPLDQSTNDRLVKLMIEQVEEAEHGSFIQGFKMGRDFAIWDSEHPEEAPEGGEILPS
ncbi:MAG: hypothetical protein SPD95_04890 [Candidatus Faecousia sp.]|nr:hypothetical protein [Candidatus Faecousia sp.]